MRAALKQMFFISMLLSSTSVFASGIMKQNQIDFCHIVQACKIPYPPGSCPDPKNVPPADFAFDDNRCSEARLLQSRGAGPGSPFGFELYQFLGEAYRVKYEVTDSVSISRERLEYLLNDLPLAAKLINHYQSEPYTAVYLDAAHTHFRGSKGKNLHGDARLVSGSIAERRLFYFGSGEADFMWWKLTGPALMDFTYWAVSSKPGKVGYQMKILVFPGNGFVNKIMNLGVFRKLVFSEIRGVIVDITQTADKLNAAGGADIQRSSDWTPDEKKKVANFFNLP